jgi:hypothetical protein
METIKTLSDIYSFSGFRARARLKPHPQDSGGRIVELERRQKKLSAQAAVEQYQASGIGVLTWFETWMPEQPASTLHSNTGGLPVRIAKP